MRGALIAALVALAIAATTAAGAALISGRQIKAGTITGRNVKAHSLGARELRGGLAPQGATGPAGPGTTYTRIAEPKQTISGDSDSQTWNCPAGTAINGGADYAGDSTVWSEPTNATVPGSADGTPGAWKITIFHPAGGTWSYHPWIVCAE